MHGILNLNKPPSLSSRDVVNIVQKVIRPVKTGHAGTLDPLAEGVLVIPVGHATKLVEYIQRLPKTYKAKFILGKKSDTEDICGRVEDLVDPPQPTRDQLEQALPLFHGTISQMPPIYSALKVGGKRAYDLARQGKEVKLEARPIEVYSIKILAYHYPDLRVEIHCGSGTYVRSLGRDLAQMLGTDAVMAHLTRTAIGDFRIEQAVKPILGFDLAAVQKNLSPPVRAVQDLPKVTIDHEAIVRLSQGKQIEVSLPHTAGEVAALTEQGDLAAVIKPGKESGWRSVKNFANDFL